MPFSDDYNATFDGVGFMELYSARFSAPRPSKKVQYTSRKVPGGSKTITESTGRILAPFSVPVACLEAQLDLLESKLDSKKTLVRANGTISNVVLLEINDPIEFKDKGSNEDIWKATLVFIETS